jgi:hypothetical protein
MPAPLSPAARDLGVHGMRVSEVLALSWDDIDFAASVIHVRHQLARGRRGVPPHRIQPKTRASVREIPLLPQLLDEKKYGRRDELRNRARKRVQLLGRYVDEREIREGVQVEVVTWREVDVGGVPRPLVPPDDDSLDTCEAVRVYAAANDVSMVTGDTNIKLLARESELQVTVLDEQDMQTFDAEDK